jgi:hypothetical protein
MKRQRMLIGCLALTLIALVGTDAAAATKDELKQRFKDRYPTLVELKDAGKVGEIHTGYIGAVRGEYLDDRVDPDDEESVRISDFIAAENGDRRQLYEILAEETGADVDDVAARNAQRNFDKAEAEHYLKPENRDWVRKKDL